jgi:hypothetical protein
MNGYRIQRHTKECSNCIYLDRIKERISDNVKVKVFVCRIDHTEIQPFGICNEWRGGGT